MKHVVPPAELLHSACAHECRGDFRVPALEPVEDKSESISLTCAAARVTRPQQDTQSHLRVLPESALESLNGDSRMPARRTNEGEQVDAR
jgi:hypothetical protein